MFSCPRTNRLYEASRHCAACLLIVVGESGRTDTHHKNASLSIKAPGLFGGSIKSSSFVYPHCASYVIFSHSFSFFYLKKNSLPWLNMWSAILLPVFLKMLLIIRSRLDLIIIQDIERETSNIQNVVAVHRAMSILTHLIIHKNYYDVTQ